MPLLMSTSDSNKYFPDAVSWADYTKKKKKPTVVCKHFHEK